MAEMINSIPAVLLVGGKGTRLQSVVQDRPKPMAIVEGRPFVEWLILSLKLQGIRRFVLCTEYMHEFVQNYFGDGAKLGVEIVYARESTPLGTAGALRNALDFIQASHFFVLNGDSYCRFDPAYFVRCHQDRQSQLSLWLTEVENCDRYGSVTVATSGAIQEFREKSPLLGAGLINAGIYLIERKVIAPLPQGQNISIEEELFPSLIGNGLFGVLGNAEKHGTFLDIGSPEAYQSSSTILHEEFRLIQNQISQQTQEFNRQRAQTHLLESAKVLQQTAAACADVMVSAAEAITEAFRNGNKLLLCGNGGSAADAQHVAAEFVSRLTKDFDRPGLPAIALTTDTSFLTAFANDCGFDGIFERQVRTLGKAGDVLIGISTSGNSKNVILAMQAASAMGIKTIGLLGEGGALTKMVDIALVVPNRDTQFVQESLLAIEHVLCDLTERALFL